MDYQIGGSSENTFELDNGIVEMLTKKITTMDDDDDYFGPSQDRSRKEVLEYSQINVPTSMRSLYWQYFGFPADKFNNIITKRRIICTICNKAISYNKNTTNLRTHLVAKHSHILYELNGGKVVAGTPPKPKPKVKIVKVGSKKIINIKHVPILRKVKDDPLPDEDATEQAKINEQNKIIESLVSSNIMSVPRKRDSSDATAATLVVDFPDSQPYQIEEIDCSNIPPSQETMTDLVTEMIIRSLLPPSFADGTGFVNFLFQLSPNALAPSKNAVKQHIKSIYETTFINLTESLKLHSQKYPFSLGFEIWQNLEQEDMISVFVNYIQAKNERNLRSVLYRTEYLYDGNLEEILRDINLKNCSVAVVNGESPIVSNFLASAGVQSIPCFFSLIQNCLKRALKIPAVDSIVKEVDMFLKDNEDAVEDDLFPDIHEEFPLTKLNMLSYFCEKFSTAYTIWTDKTNDLLDKAKELIDCLSPLKLTIETLSDEPIALASLLKPFTAKLLSEYFCSRTGDSVTIKNIKQIIHNELSSNILNNSFLLTASFFDPRFLNYIDGENLEIVKGIVESKFQNIIDYDDSNVTQCKKETDENNKRKSSLKMFFKSDEFKRTPKPIKNNLSQEFSKYLSEICHIEQCPLAWWNEIGYSYRQLKIIADNYICVPANVSSIYNKPISEQIEFFDKRLMLKNESGKRLLFLHFNK